MKLKFFLAECKVTNFIIWKPKILLLQEQKILNKKIEFSQVFAVAVQHEFS